MLKVKPTLPSYALPNYNSSVESSSKRLPVKLPDPILLL